MKYYYKLIDNDTDELFGYIVTSGYTTPENLCDLYGFNGYHAELCTKQEHDEDEYIEIPELKKIKPCPSCGAKMDKK